MTARRVTYKKYAGITISGTTQWTIPTSTTEHLERAAWLTAIVETGAKWGTVQSYDGAAMSAGIEHKIALLPRSMEQGELWGLLAKLPDCPGVAALEAAIAAVGWYVDVRGDLRVKSTGALVSGSAIREEFTPVGGVVPATGPNLDKAMRWANLWAAAFSDPATYRVQISEAKRGLLNLHKELESRVYKTYGNLDDASAATTSNLPAEVEFAMCIYHSFSVNAPTKARSILQRTLNSGPKDHVVFAKRLIRNLGTDEYANWQQRYVSTRTKAKNSGLWNPQLFVDIAPEKL